MKAAVFVRAPIFVPLVVQFIVLAACSLGLHSRWFFCFGSLGLRRVDAKE
jgi:hypothetical protein